MSTVKISELPSILQINANTANTIMIALDKPTNITGQMTLTTLARGLYSNNNLNVGNTYTVLPNALAQFTGTSELYIQTSLQNLAPNGSGDIVVTADNGTDTAHFIDMGVAGSTYVFEGDSLNKPNDGYLIMVGDSPVGQGGNLTIGTLTEQKDINIVQGGLSQDNVTVKFLHDAGLKLTKFPLIFADGTTQNSAVTYTSINSRITSNVSALNSSITSNVTSLNSEISANVVTLRGEITANAVSANSVINARITSNIATVNTFAQASFDKANSALANTDGVITAGALIVPGNITATGNLNVSNSTFDYVNTALVRIIGSSGAFTQPPANPGYMLSITGVDGISSRIVNSSYGSGAYALFAGRKGNGTAGTPTAVANNDVIARFSGSGYNGSGFTATGQGRIDIVADEDFTTANNGSRIEFYNTIPKTNTVTKIATLNANTATFTGSIYPNKGFIYTPRVLSGAQTAITIDFAEDSMIRATFNNTLTISLSNYKWGKVVEVWLTNTAGNGQTVNFGTLANNSTTGATSLSVAAGRSARLTYFSIDGDQANTFVAVNYA